MDLHWEIKRDNAQECICHNVYFTLYSSEMIQPFCHFEASKEISVMFIIFCNVLWLNIQSEAFKIFIYLPTLWSFLKKKILVIYNLWFRNSWLGRVWYSLTQDMGIFSWYIWAGFWVIKGTAFMLIWNNMMVKCGLELGCVGCIGWQVL